MNLRTEPYIEQMERWPRAGKHIMAQHDKDTIVVYQAYTPAIGLYAAEHQRFGDSFKFTRMSWIKPNFLWMMFRSGWGMKENQEVTLAITLKKEGFLEILWKSVASTFDPTQYETYEEWKTAGVESDVRLQWDPDHDPTGAKVERRALQLGLRGDTLRKYAHEWIVQIEDISPFVQAQREYALQGEVEKLWSPTETPLYIEEKDLRAKLGM
ncbi:DUF4291 domain-containing protein [Mechercharimyces sp. CAU 1602]|uniref:DUF4291 domain-containing protein n=1 Tax=Mechercharimyces sp. CAU 1602 TaxID=2973933 RepID=UPI0021639803|nr:DUF4291 domain-containing protein [Mechercharimyces sp. CAU 1602]MCS1350214.1 DUF4291 domain-containing protein [Mechercharimyces sp. CAU 1602]